MNRVVADASFCGAWILPDEASRRAEQLLNGLITGSHELWVPSLWRYEMLNLVFSASRRGRLNEAMVPEAISLLKAVPLACSDVPGSVSQERLMRLALRFNLSAYDAAYIELADRLQVPLYTENRSLRKAAGKLALLPA